MSFQRQSEQDHQESFNAARMTAPALSRAIRAELDDALQKATPFHRAKTGLQQLVDRFPQAHEVGEK